MRNEVGDWLRVRGVNRLHNRHASYREGQCRREHTAALAGRAIAATSIVGRSRLRRRVASFGVMMIVHGMRSMIAVCHPSHRPRRPNAVHDER